MALELLVGTGTEWNKEPMISSLFTIIITLNSLDWVQRHPPLEGPYAFPLPLAIHKTGMCTQR